MCWRKNEMLYSENTRRENEFKNKEIELDTNCITGYNNYLLNRLKTAFKRAKKVDIIVSFLMESGVKLLKKDLESVVKRNVPVRILTGNYLNITQPEALYILKDIMGNNIDLRFYNDKSRSFHPKAYIFYYEQENGEIFIGSSNMSASALTRGIEWNYRIDKKQCEIDFNYFTSTFENLFLNYSIIVDDNELRRYSKQWKKPKIFTREKNIDEFKVKEGNVISLPQPRGAQIEALYELKRARAEGMDKALVIAATGIGKTYLAAFDSKSYSTVLFIAHREEILNQAAKSFKSINPTKSIGFFGKSYRDTDKDIIFATVQTLGKEEYLNDKYFEKNYFDYIVIDEFHHAVCKKYKNIIQYFTPKFLLGLTATPERMDNKDVFALCDYNVVYEARLKEAINKEWLVPFRYYGIYDMEVDYSNIKVKSGRYDEIQLEKALSINKRAKLVLNHYKKYNSKRALGFCASKNHADFMADYFNKNKVPSCAVVSGEELSNTMHRKDAIRKLNKGDIKVIFSVNMFNEGLDIPSIDMVMFLRPTESSTIFLQQLGRGLRKTIGKKYLNVLDFIGNYKKANLIPFFLTGDEIKKVKKDGEGYMPREEEYPEGCLANFDFQLIDLFKKQFKQEKSIKDLIKEEYLKIKQYIGKRPSRCELYTYMEENIYENMKKKSKLNVFREYLTFLNIMGELTEKEKEIIDTKAHKFIKVIERTPMTKMYKMPLLLSFYNEGDIRLKVDNNHIYESFLKFYSKPSNALDLLKDKSRRGYKNWGKVQYINLAQKPKEAFLKTGQDFFYEEGKFYCIKDDLKKFIQNEFFIKNFKDVIDYKTMRFYKERLDKIRNEIYIK